MTPNPDTPNIDPREIAKERVHFNGDLFVSRELSGTDTWHTWTVTVRYLGLTGEVTKRGDLHPVEMGSLIDAAVTKLVEQAESQAERTRKLMSKVEEPSHD